MEDRMTWETVQKKYPDQWVSLCDVFYDATGEIISAIVIAAGPDLHSVTHAPLPSSTSQHQFKFTGAVKNFLGFSAWNIDNAAAQ